MVSLRAVGVVIIGYAYVVGDILHFGHILHLKNCKSLCDKLIVGVLTDKAVMEKKSKPTIEFPERIRLVAELKSVDAAVAQETYLPIENVAAIRPDVLFESWSHDEPYHNPYGKTIVMPYYPVQSSSLIKEGIRDD